MAEWKFAEGLMVGRVAPGRPVAGNPEMATSKIVLSRSQDIPFNKLSLSQANVRRVKAGVSIEALAESIVRHSLLQGRWQGFGSRVHTGTAAAL